LQYLAAKAVFFLYRGGATTYCFCGFASTQVLCTTQRYNTCVTLLPFPEVEPGELVRFMTLIWGAVNLIQVVYDLSTGLALSFFEPPTFMFTRDRSPKVASSTDSTMWLPKAITHNQQS
jgi:hypothetical protein